MYVVLIKCWQMKTSIVNKCTYNLIQKVEIDNCNYIYTIN